MAKRPGSAKDGTQIQIKRTSKLITSQAVADDGVLKYGEPLYVDGTVQSGSADTDVDSQKLLVFGDRNADTQSPTATSQLQVFSSEPRSLSGGKLFNTNQPAQTRLIKFVDVNNNELFPELKRFTIKDNLGIPKDSAGNQVKVTVNGTWYPVVASGNTIVVGSTPLAAGSTQYPRAQKVTVTGMSSDISPFISLAMTPAQMANKDSIRSTNISFGAISLVNSDQNRIDVICGYKPLTQDIYLNVFGG